MTTSREFLELVLSGEAVTAEHVDALVKERVKEDEHLEYKRGAVFRDGKSNNELSRMIRRYMSGFANSDGGVLIIGVEEEERQSARTDALESRPIGVDGCNDRSIEGDLASWAAECVNELGAYFSPSPKFRVIEHPKGEVLVCAAGRSYGLVPVYVEGKAVYYYRLGEHMLPAPDYLVADMRLGRRARPNLEVRKAYTIALKRMTSQSDHPQVFLQFDLVVEVENAGLVWAEGSLYGLVLVNRFVPTMLPIKIPASLSEHIDLQDVQFQVDGLWINGMPLILRGGSKLERPFDAETIRHTFEVPLALYGKVHSYVWRAALYLLARDCPPVWYQVNLRIDSKLNWLLKAPYQQVGKLPDNWDGFSFTRATSERPVVGWIPLPEAEESALTK